MVFRKLDALTLIAFAFLVRLFALLFAGGFDSVLGYDDGVYYSAATALNHGLIPYRDFVLVHPPGILFVLSPFVWISHITTDAFGFYLARIFFMAVGALSTWMIYRIGSRWSRGAGIVAALFYAVWTPVIRVERTAYLEGLGILCTLIALYILLERRSPKRDAITIGLLLGVATTMKIWYAVVVVVVILWLTLQRQLHKAVIIGATSLTTFLALCGFFILKSGSKFFDLVLYAQTQRGNEEIPLINRLRQIFNIESLTMAPNLNITYLALMLLAGLLVKFIADNFKDRISYLILSLFIFQLVVLLKTPVFFNAYPSFIAPSLALIFGISISRLPSRILVVAIMAFAIPLGLHSAMTQEPGRDLPNKLERLSFAKSKCVTSDSPAVLVLLNTLSRNLDNNCAMIFDVSGEIFGLDNGRNPLHENSKQRRLSSEEYQRAIEGYLAEGGTIILARKTIDGLTTKSWQQLLAGRKVTHTHSFIIISRKLSAS